MQLLKNIFRYGAVGTALDGFRDSEIADQSTHTLNNFYISEMGTLRVAKKYNPVNLGVTLVKFRDTKYHFFVGLTSTELITFRKSDKAVLSRVGHGLAIPDHTVNFNIFNNFIFVQGSNGVKVFAFNNSGALGTTNFFDTIKLPFQNKLSVKIDYYKVFRIPVLNPEYSSSKPEIPMYIDELRPELMATYDDNLELSVSGGRVVLKNLNINVDRVYRQFKAALTKDDLTGVAEGMTILVFRNYKIADGSAYYHFGNTKISFTGETSDGKYGGTYFTGATPDTAGGLLVYGILENFMGNIRDIAEFQSRLVLASDEKIYFSKTLDYNNFVPGTDSEDAFFIKPSPIDGNQPNIYRLTTGTGLYVTCEKGVVVIGYGSHLTPATSMNSVRIAGNSPMTKISALVEDDFYYIDATGQLRCILLNVESGVVQFTNNIAEKYTFKRGNIKNLSFGVINEDNVLIATMSDANKIKVYNKIEGTLFRNFTLDIDTTYPVWGYNENLISGNNFLGLSHNNVEKANLTLNIPNVVMKGRGVFLNDFELTYDRMVLNILNQNKSVLGITVKSRELPDKPLQNLGITTGDYNIYDLMSTISIIHPEIEINTTQSADTVELRGINLMLGGG
ncbi:MAG: hypothetical protein ACRCX7_07130 [Cetobacterium sp.]|uniref:hypothetical protein n=1 Tax=Cetobacterium sp. TaxID=2071632 RepID=UPI003F3181A7